MIFDIIVWYYVKDLVVFDEKGEITEGTDNEQNGEKEKSMS